MEEENRKENKKANIEKVGIVEDKKSTDDVQKKAKDEKKKRFCLDAKFGRPGCLLLLLFSAGGRKKKYN